MNYAFTWLCYCLIFSLSFSSLRFPLELETEEDSLLFTPYYIYRIVDDGASFFWFCFCLWSDDLISWPIESTFFEKQKTSADTVKFKNASMISLGGHLPPFFNRPEINSFPPRSVALRCFLLFSFFLAKESSFSFVDFYVQVQWILKDLGISEVSSDTGKLDHESRMDDWNDGRDPITERVNRNDLRWRPTADMIIRRSPIDRSLENPRIEIAFWTSSSGVSLACLFSLLLSNPWLSGEFISLLLSAGVMVRTPPGLLDYFSDFCLSGSWPPNGINVFLSLIALCMLLSHVTLMYWYRQVSLAKSR